MRTQLLDMDERVAVTATALNVNTYVVTTMARLTINGHTNDDMILLIIAMRKIAEVIITSTIISINYAIRRLT